MKDGEPDRLTSRRETCVDPSDLDLGIYLHVPFCATSCDFCAFYQVQGDRSAVSRYLDCVERELDLIGDVRRADTFFWGGGTPGLLLAKDLARLGDRLTGRFGQPRKEWTVEMAPSTVKADKLRALKESGVTRVSMGVQSFDDDLLEKLGRQHSSKQIFKAYEMIREAAFDSVNIDLMFALPGQTERDFERDLKVIERLQPDHLSTYCLTFEEDTALYVTLSEGKVERSEARERAFYRFAWRAIEEIGFSQYEISNYAKPGHRSAHNCGTWGMNEWIGIGPSAASQFDGMRGANPPDLEKWQEAIASNRRAQSDRQALDRSILLEDSLIFGLRMNEGIDLDELGERFEVDVRRLLGPLIARWADQALAENEGSKVRLTEEGRLLADAIGEELVGLIAG